MRVLSLSGEWLVDVVSKESYYRNWRQTGPESMIIYIHKIK
jgi:hypothetical protein